MYIFLDESGQFTKYNSEEYFVVGSFTVGDPKRIEKRFRSWQYHNLPKRMRGNAEIKFSATNISLELRLKMLRFLSKLDIRIRFIYLKRANIPESYWKKQRIQSGELYTHVIGELLEMYFPINDMEFRVFCDKRHLQGITHSHFENILKVRLLPNLPKDSLVQIQMVDSTTNENIQIADWISGAIASYLEKKLFGEKYYEILKNNIVGIGKELFPDYWMSKYK